MDVNAGGVITRAVLGSVDEKTNRISPHPSLGESTENNLFLFEGMLANTLPLQSVGPGGPIDGQPDIFSFSFNGYSGKFILDTIGPNKSLRAVALSNQGLKIELTGFGADQLISEFKITDPNGVQYLFGDDATEYTQNIGGCGAKYTNYPTAWYLKKITHPSGDITSFYYSPLTYSYATGISETVYVFTGTVTAVPCGAGGSTIGPPSPQNVNCTNRMQTTGVLLDSITSTFGSKIKFNYVGRSDDDDRLISSINVFGVDHVTLFKTFTFQYTNASSRPFLISLFEQDALGQVIKKHKFGYNDMFAVPAALSFSQDLWGYFNGKQNTTSIPKPKDPSFAQSLTLATANRDPNPLYAAKGLLNSVTYPTGGKDSVVYEGNQSYQVNVVYPGQQTSTFIGNNNTGTGSQRIFTSTEVISLSFRQQVVFSGECSTTSSTINSTRSTYVQIIDTNGNLVDTYTLSPGKDFTKPRIMDPGSYRLQVVTFGDFVRATGHLTYVPSNVVTQTSNITVGGVRVAKIITYDGFSDKPIVKKYTYNKFSNPDQSSAGTVNIPFYERAIKLYVQCTAAGLCEGGPGFDFKTSSSNGPLSLFRTPAPVSYANVTESFGENFENGGIEHIFTVSPDRDASQFNGDFIPGAPNGNESCWNGLEQYQGTFKVLSNQKVYTKKVYTHYDGVFNNNKKHPEFNDSYTGYIVTEKLHIACSPPYTNNQVIFLRQNYSTTYYSIHKSWIYADTVRTQTYDKDGLNYTQEYNIYEYNNGDNARPTLMKTIASNQDTLKTTNLYPSDFLTTSPYSDMVNQHILTPVITKTRYDNSDVIDIVKTNYNNWGNTLFLPQTVEYAIGTHTPEVRVRYYNYDIVGNPLSFSKEKGPIVSYIWGYGGIFPIAKVGNSDYSTIVAALGGTAAVETFRQIKNPTDIQVANFLAPLRTSFSLRSAEVTSNTYNLISGLTSSTDSKGDITYFEYDSFQRLKNVKDKDGKIIRRVDYHYQGQ